MLLLFSQKNRYRLKVFKGCVCMDIPQSLLTKNACMDRMVKKRGKHKDKSNFNKAIIFLLILAIYAIIRSTISPADLTKEAKIVLDILTDENTAISLLEANVLIEDKIIELEQMDYGEIKNILGVQNDFCVFFEDISGNLVKIDDIGFGIGSSKIYINGQPCR